MLNAWRKRAASQSAGDRFNAFATGVALAVVSAFVGALIAVAVIDGRDVDWNWTVIADIVGGLALGTAALFGAINGVGALRQRTAADQRAEWWKRAEKCGDYLLAGDAELEDDPYVLGIGLLNALWLEDERTGNREKGYLFALSNAAALDDFEDSSDNEQESEGAPDGQDD